MSSLADLPLLAGFFSYSREDDEDSGGRLSQLRQRIQAELRGQLGRSLERTSNFSRTKLPLNTANSGSRRFSPQLLKLRFLFRSSRRPPSKADTARLSSMHF
jgi:hypothetical protein